ncbi:MAG: O-antigen ligase family protein [Candidatus Paceibacterota bacterium]
MTRHNVYVTALRYGLIGLVFVVPFVALIVTNSLFYPFITGKAIAFRALVSVLVGGWLILACLDPDARPRRSPLLYAFLGFVAVVGVANLFGVDPVQSVWSNFERMEGFVTVLFLLGFVLVTSSLLSSERLWGAFFHISIGVALIIGVYALSGDSVRSSNLLGNSIYLAIYMLIHAFLAGLYLVRTWGANIWITLGYGVVIVCTTIVMVLTDTRGTAIGLLISLLVMAACIAFLERRRLVLRRVAQGGVVAGILVVGVFSAALAVNNLAPEIRDESQIVQAVNRTPLIGELATIDLVSVNSATTRFYIWGLAWQGFLERPALGWGQENFTYVFNSFYDPILVEREQWFDRAHNTFLDWLTAAGALGFLTYVSLYVVLLWLLWRDPEDTWTLYEKIVLTGLITAYAVHNLFVFDSLTSYILFGAVMAYVISRTTSSDARLFGRLPAVPVLPAYALVTPVCVLIVAGAIYVSAYKPLMASTSLIEALTHISAVRYDRGLESFERALDWSDGTTGTQEIREQLMVKTSEVASTAPDSEISNAFISLANTEMERHRESFPGQTRPYVLWSSMLADLGDHVRAEEALELARRNSPSKQLIHFYRMELALDQGKYEEAVEAARTAYELDPTYHEAIIRYATALRFAGNETEADEVLAALSDGGLFNERLLRPYMERGEYAAVIAVRRQRVEILSEQLENASESDRPRAVQRVLQEQVLISSTYAQMGQIATAIRLLEELKTVYPSYRAQLDKFIEELRSGN